MGAPGDDGIASNAGASYVFENSGGGWSQTKKLTDAAGESSDTYGWDVGVSGDRIAVGAPGRGTGTVYWYTGSGSNWKALDSIARYEPVRSLFAGVTSVAAPPGAEPGWAPIAGMFR